MILALASRIGLHGVESLTAWNTMETRQNRITNEITNAIIRPLPVVSSSVAGFPIVSQLS
jgi:hypothetical protein